MPKSLKHPKQQAKSASRFTKIFLGYVRPRSPGLIHARFMDSLLGLIAGSSGKYRIRPVAMEVGPLISRARNRLLEEFLKTDDEYFLWIDTDIVFGISDLEALLALDKAIAGSVYLTLDESQQPVCAHLDELPDSPGRYTDVSLERLYDTEGKPMEPFTISGLGMGFTLVRRDVIESLGPIKRLFPFAERDADHGYGEDLTFCLRAAEKGFEAWVVPASKVGHMKEIEL